MKLFQSILLVVAAGVCLPSVGLAQSGGIFDDVTSPAFGGERRVSVDAGGAAVDVLFVSRIRGGQETPLDPNEYVVENNGSSQAVVILRDPARMGDCIRVVGDKTDNDDPNNAEWVRVRKGANRRK